MSRASDTISKCLNPGSRMLVVACCCSTRPSSSKSISLMRSRARTRSGAISLNASFAVREGLSHVRWSGPSALLYSRLPSERLSTAALILTRAAASAAADDAAADDDDDDGAVAPAAVVEPPAAPNDALTGVSISC